MTTSTPALLHRERRIACSGPNCLEHSVLVPESVAADPAAFRRMLSAYGLFAHPTDPTKYFCSGPCRSAPPLAQNSIDGGRPEASALHAKLRAAQASTSVGQQMEAKLQPTITLTCPVCRESKIDVRADYTQPQLQHFLAVSGWSPMGTCRVECTAADPRSRPPAPAAPLDLSSVNQAMESVNRGAALGRRRRGEPAWPGDAELLATSDAARAKAAKPATKTKPTPATGAR